MIHFNRKKLIQYIREVLKLGGIGMGFDMSTCEQGDIDYLKEKKQLELDWITGDDINIYVKKITLSDETVALIQFDFLMRDDVMDISYFEVVQDLRSKGIGSDIIKEILQDPAIKVCQLYPKNEMSKKFWERIGFNKTYDGVGEYIWRYSK